MRASAWIGELRDGLAARRDELSESLRRIGFDVLHTEGTYFVTADPTPLGVTDAARWCLALPERVGVAAVPFDPFCADFGADFSHLVRFAFCKRPEVLAEAERRLEALRG